jgi:hypothetical protein
MEDVEGRGKGCKNALTLEQPNGIKSESSVITASTSLFTDKNAICASAS